MESTPPLERRSLPHTPAPTLAAEDDATSAGFVLRIKQLPSSLSSDAVTSLLSHYGASRVRVLKRKKPGAALRATGADSKVTQVAIAEFPSRQRMTDAHQRLARVQLAGKKLVVEEIQSAHDGDADATIDKPPGDADGDREATKAPPPDPTTSDNAPPSKATRRANRHNNSAPAPLHNNSAPAPLAPHLGLHYAPSPLLTYKYPKASVPVVRNIANALMALPRFYNQVLHLMNKMNLPTPFELGAIPGVFADAFMVDVRQQQRQSQHQTDHQRTAHGINADVEEEEEESEEEEEEEDTEHAALRPTKRHRTDVASSEPTNLIKKRPRGAIHTQTAAAFDDGEERRRLAALKPLRPGVISAAELDLQRLAGDERSRDPAYAGYTTGTPSLQVHVSNLAESVDAKDLEYVFGHALPLETPLESLAIDLQWTTASAVVSFPSLESAERAIELIHGVVLEGKPLVVRYHHVQVTSEPEPTRVEPPKTAERVESTPAERKSHWKQMDSAQLAVEKAMKNYTRGEPTQALYIKNLAKAVDEATLRSLAREFTPPSVSLESLSIRHFTEGRMKNQAFIEFPSADAASVVLEAIHGLVLHGKPLVVSFRKAQPPAPS